MISATCSEKIGKFHLICTQRGPVLRQSNGVSFIWIMASYIRLSLQSPNKRWDFRWYQCDTPRNKCFPGNIEIFCITYKLKTRSTARAQTSTALNWRHVEQSCQPWSNLPSNVPGCSLFHAESILKISSKSIHLLFRNVVNRRKNRQTNQQGGNITIRKFGR